MTVKTTGLWPAMLDVSSVNNAGSKKKINMRPFQKQAGGMDCGLFARAAVTVLTFNINPSDLEA